MKRKMTIQKRIAHLLSYEVLDVFPVWSIGLFVLGIAFILYGVISNAEAIRAYLLTPLSEMSMWQLFLVIYFAHLLSRK